MVCALLSHTHHVTFYHVTVTLVTLSCAPFCIVSPKEKEKKYNDLAILPSHDNNRDVYGQKNNSQI